MRTSRTIPPPKAVTQAMTMTPKMSRWSLTPAIAPSTAKVPVAARSTWRTRPVTVSRRGPSRPLVPLRADVVHGPSVPPPPGSGGPSAQPGSGVVSAQSDPSRWRPKASSQ